jgi:hypothetical protein
MHLDMSTLLILKSHVYPLLKCSVSSRQYLEFIDLKKVFGIYFYPEFMCSVIISLPQVVGTLPVLIRNIPALPENYMS